MTVLRIISTLVWAALLLYMLPAAWAAIARTHTRRGDPVRLGMAIICLTTMGFNLRWLIAPQSELTWKVLYVLSALAAVYHIILARVYGRGVRM